MTVDNAAAPPLRKRVFWPVTGLPGYSIDLLVAGGAAAAGTDALSVKSSVLSKEAASNANMVGAIAGTDRNARARAIGNGNPAIVPINSLNMQGLLVTTANDGVEWSGMIPYDLDRTFKVGLRPIWTHATLGATTGRSVTWLATHGSIASGSALAAGGTALDTVIGSHAVSAVTANTLMRGNRGIINANTFAASKYFWSFKLLASALTGFAGGEYIYLLGVEVDYMPRRLQGRRALKDADLEIL